MSNTYYPDFRADEELPADINEMPREEASKIVMERMRLLHICGQYTWHSPAYVFGNRNGLTVLRDAITEALALGTAETHATVADGEGYTVTVDLHEEQWDHAFWQKCQRPYNDPVACGGPDPLIDIQRLEQALREANAELFKRGGKPILNPLPDKPNV